MLLLYAYGLFPLDTMYLGDLNVVVKKLVGKNISDIFISWIYCLSNLALAINLNYFLLDTRI